MRYEYFVSYRSERSYGNVLVTRDKEIDSMENIRCVEEWVSKDIGAQAIVINWKLLSKKSSDEVLECEFGVLTFGVDYDPERSFCMRQCPISNKCRAKFYESNRS